MHSILTLSTDLSAFLKLLNWTLNKENMGEIVENM